MALTQEIVAQLRALAEAGLLDVKAAAAAHGVARETIRRALRGETFARVPPARTNAELDTAAAASEEWAKKLLAQQGTQATTAAEATKGLQDIKPSVVNDVKLPDAYNFVNERKSNENT